MDVAEILNLSDVLYELKTRKVVSAHTTRLTSRGENFESLILEVDVTFQDEDQEKETLCLVAKLLPPNSTKQLNHCVIFRNELFFYHELVPIFRNLLQEENYKNRLHLVPKFFGGRLSLDSTSSEIDENAIIILENLRKSDFCILDITVGFDTKTTDLVLAKMAEFHATTLALKQKKPALFQESIVSKLEEYTVSSINANDECMTSEEMINAIVNAAKQDDLCVLHLARIEDMLDRCSQNICLPKNSSKFSQSDFATLIHGNLSANNIMVKTRMNTTVDVKFLDWKLFEHASLVRDVLFFIFTSVQEANLKNFDRLILFYHKNLITNLEELKCDVEKFSLNAFEKELKSEASQFCYSQVVSALTSIPPIAPANNSADNTTTSSGIPVSEVCKRRLCQITKIFIQKRWL